MPNMALGRDSDDADDKIVFRLADSYLLYMSFDWDARSIDESVSEYLFRFLITWHVPDSGHLFCFVVSLFAGKDLQVVIITSEQAKLLTLLALYI